MLSPVIHRRHNRLDRRPFFREQAECLTVGIERLKAAAAAKDEAQAAVGG
jgi:hypothetical protein